MTQDATTESKKVKNVIISLAKHPRMHTILLIEFVLFNADKSAPGLNRRCYGSSRNAFTAPST